MCTASWSFDSDSTALCFSRDERKARARARPPMIERFEGVTCIAPRDEAAKGTWILVNAFGLCVFLLNHYGAGVASVAGRSASRGSLPSLFAGQRSVRDARARFDAVVPTEALQPFHLCFLDQAEAACISWNGRTVSETDISEGFLTTSSFRTDEVEQYRLERFRVLRDERDGDAEHWHLRLHRDTANTDPAFNPLMLRPESETHCISLVALGRDEVRFDYWGRVSETFDWEPMTRTTIPRRR